MANFTKLAQTAKRLIDKNGRDVSVEKLDKTPADSAKPWEPDPTLPVATAVSGKAVFVSPSDLGIVTENVGDVVRAEQVALFAAANDCDEALEDFDQIVDDCDVKWRILRTEVLKPASTKLLYQFEVSR